MANVTGVIIPEAITDGEKVRAEMLHDFGIEIGTSFGPLAGKIWRIGTMGYVCRKANVLRCLTALEAVLRRNHVKLPDGAAVEAAYRSLRERVGGFRCGIGGRSDRRACLTSR